MPPYRLCILALGFSACFEGGGGTSGGGGLGLSPDADRTSPDASPGSHTLPHRVDIASLPFTHTGNTASSLSRTIDTYPCAPDIDESGGEVWYSIGMDYAVPLRITITPQNDVEVDLHVLVQGDEAPERTCLTRADTSIDITVPPGNNFLVIDTPVIDGVERAGEYLLSITTPP